jgi:mono/diheme cytochrome c family protein
MENTLMGQNGGTTRSTAAVGREPDLTQVEEAKTLIAQFQLSGADLYRINCRSCHGPEGNGAPPEIHSLIGPVQATSAAMIQKRMEARGAPIAREMAAQMAGQAEKAIRDRLQHDGEKMPAFAYLRPEEVTALLSYLDQLAGVPGKQHMLAVNDSARKSASKSPRELATFAMMQPALAAIA